MSGTSSAAPPESGTSSDPPTVTTTSVRPVGTPPLPALSMPCMGQIPQIPRFTGEGRATGESFGEWHEHFENVATLVGWDEHWKLVHLTTNLRYTATAFYRSCSEEVRSKYTSLVAATKRRFTPIRLTAVQAQLFHNRQQQEKEAVDQFAQELQKLYNLAYAGATSEGPHAERMGQTLLANQFVTGLRPELKRKLIGTEGSLEELLLKARFEEAKSRELTMEKTRIPAPPRTQWPTPSTEQPVTTSMPVKSSNSPATGGARGTRFKCFNCGMEGHMARSCSYPKRNRRDDEAR